MASWAWILTTEGRGGGGREGGEGGGKSQYHPPLYETLLHIHESGTRLVNSTECIEIIPLHQPDFLLVFLLLF